MHMQNYLSSVNTSKISLRVLLGSVFLLPWLLLPFTDQFIGQTKILIGIVATLTLGFLYLISVIKTKLIKVDINPFTLPLVLFGIAILASSFLSGNYPVEHLLGIGGTYLSMVMIVLWGGFLIKDKGSTKNFITLLSASGVVLTISSVFQQFGYGPSLLLNRFLPLSLPNTLVFNMSGSSLIAIQVIILALVGLVSLFVIERRLSLLHRGLGAVLIAGLVLHGWSLLPGQPANPTLLPVTASWQVSIGSLKTPRSALFGYGPEGFMNAFNQHKPVWINDTDQWNVQFSQASNMPFSLLVSTGVLGLSAWLFLIFKIVKHTKHTPTQVKPIHWMLLTSIAFNFMFPPATVILLIQAFLLTMWVVEENDRFYQIEIYSLIVRFIKRRNIISFITDRVHLILPTFGVVLLVLLLTIGYGVSRAYFASYKLFQANWAARNNDIVRAYVNQQQAVRLNPYSDVSRQRYAMTNLTIAAALVQKTDKTPEENQQFSQLVQQAIREGRAATWLDSGDTNNWKVLSQIYRSLIGVADGADQWVVTSLVKAIENSPADPQIRVELGGIFYSQENYTEATRFFQQAVNLKSDYPNAYYNLANSLAKMGRYDEAIAAYQQTLLLVEPDSDDYLRAAQELQLLAGQDGEIIFGPDDGN
jgi:tetratricopeptide (TPR) repeat protein